MLLTPLHSTHHALRMLMALFLPLFSMHTADRMNHKNHPRFKSPYHQYTRKKHLPSPAEQQQYASEGDDAFLIPLSSLERVERINKQGDPLIVDYDRKDTTKQYQKNDCLTFFARLKKSPPDADRDGGIITASYFFYLNKYVCSVYRPHNPNGKLQQYLANDTFDALKELFAQQEKQEQVEKALEKLANEQRQHEELERNDRSLCQDITMHLRDTSAT